MISQNPLLDILSKEERPRARHDNPRTSKVAAARINPGSLRHKILKCLEEEPMGLATFEVSKMVFKPRDIVSPNFAPLERMGYISKTGKTRINPETNAENDLYVVTEKYRSSRISRTPIPTKKMSPKDISNFIKKCGHRIEREYASINDQGFKHIPGFDMMTMKISVFLECSYSPVGMCVFKKITPSIWGMVCEFCNKERK